MVFEADSLLCRAHHLGVTLYGWVHQGERRGSSCRSPGQLGGSSRLLPGTLGWSGRKDVNFLLPWPAAAPLPPTAGGVLFFGAPRASTGFCFALRPTTFAHSPSSGFQWAEVCGVLLIDGRLHSSIVNFVGFGIRRPRCLRSGCHLLFG